MSFQLLKEQFSQQFPFLHSEELALLLSIGQYKRVKNKTQIITSGETAASFYFIINGMIRGFFLDSFGEEQTVFLKGKNTFTTVPEAFQANKKTKYTLETIGETIFIEFPIANFEQLAKENLAIAQLYIEGLKENVSVLIFRVELLATKKPEERYEAMLEQFPDFFQLAYNKHIANYLGITPNSLSRIIKRKKEGKSGRKKN